jgi:hypothetical protein
LRARLHPQNHQPPNHQRHRHRDGVEQIKLDGLDGQRANHCGRQKGQAQAHHKAQGDRVAAHAAGQRGDARAVFPAHRQDRPQLNHHFEHLALAIVKVDQIASQNQMPGAGNRKKLGNAFNDAHDQGLAQQQDVHQWLSGRACCG